MRQNNIHCLPDKRRFQKLLFFEILYTLLLFSTLFVLVIKDNEKASVFVGLIFAILFARRVREIVLFGKTLFLKNSIISIDITPTEIQLNFSGRQKKFNLDELDYDVVKDNNFSSLRLFRYLGYEIEDLVIYQNEMEIKISGYAFKTEVNLKEIETFYTVSENHQ